MQSHTRLELRLANLLGAMSLAVVDEVLEAARAEGENPSASAAIVRIGKYPGQTIDFLSRAVGLSHSATVRMIDRLENDGLVRRERDAAHDERDGRSVALYLTDDGETYSRNFLAQRYRRLLPILEHISEQQREQLASIAETLLHAIAQPEIAGHICRLCDAPTCEEQGCPVGHYPPEDQRHQPTQ